MNKWLIGGSLFILLSLLFSLTSCNQFGPDRVGELLIDHISIAQAEATTAELFIYNGVGDVRLQTQSERADELLGGTLSYNVPNWIPLVTHEINSAQVALVTVRQPELLTGLGFEDTSNVQYTYDLQLNTAVPTNLNLEMGIGQAEIDLAQQQLTQLTLRMGAGTGQVDLSQIQPANLDVLVMGGIGRTTLLLPSDIGVRVTVEGGAGLSEIKTTGLIQRDPVTFINEAFNTAVPVINIIIHPAVGTIDLQVVE